MIATIGLTDMRSLVSQRAVEHRVHEVADKHRERIRRIVLRAVRDARTAITVHQIETALSHSTHNLVAAMNVPIGVFGQTLRRVLPGMLFDCLVESARSGLDADGKLTTLKKRTSVGFQFDPTYPAAQTWARENAALLVAEITEATRETIRLMVAEAFIEGIPPRQLAVLLRPVVGLTRSQGERLVKRYAGLIADGVAVEKATATAGKWVDTAIRQRALMIARTETIRASNQGQRQLWQQAVREGYLPRTARMVWIATLGACPICLDLQGEEVSVSDGTFSGGIDVPPAHPACRCTIGVAA